MSIEKLRADAEAEIASCNKEQAEHAPEQEKVCAICDRYEIFRALLDEHEAAFSGGHLQARASTHKLAEEAIKRYGESE